MVFARSYNHRGQQKEARMRFAAIADVRAFLERSFSK